MSGADEVEKRVRESLAAPVAQAIRAQAAIQTAALGAREMGMDRATWLEAAGQSWDVLDRSWRVLEAKLAGALEKPGAVPTPAENAREAPDLRDQILPTKDGARAIVAAQIEVARRDLIAHVDECAACGRGVSAHMTACGGCAAPDAPIVPGQHLTGAGGCARYVELASVYGRAVAIASPEPPPVDDLAFRELEKLRAFAAALSTPLVLFAEGDGGPRVSAALSVVCEIAGAAGFHGYLLHRAPPAGWVLERVTKQLGSVPAGFTSGEAALQWLSQSVAPHLPPAR